jgi:hypothetical protein
VNSRQRHKRRVQKWILKRRRAYQGLWQQHVFTQGPALTPEYFESLRKYFWDEVRKLTTPAASGVGPTTQENQ